METGEPERLHRRRGARGLGSDSEGAVPQGPPTCGGQAVPPGWPDFSSGREELLAPFLTCTSPAEFLALQQRVDMPRLVETLDDWRAVRLGAQGTPREDAAGLLNRKRTSLLLEAAERYGTRGLAFERVMVALLEADAALPRAQRRFLGAFIKPRILRSVGVRKPESGLRYADVLVIEERGFSRGPPRVETFSFKSRDLSGLKYEALEAQMKADAREALGKYGGALDIRRDSLRPLLSGGSEVPVQRVRLVYEGGALLSKDVEVMKAAVEETRREVPGVEVSFQ